jgi:hypothetical protein
VIANAIAVKISPLFIIRGQSCSIRFRNEVATP